MQDATLLTKTKNELQDYSKCVQGFDEFMKKGKQYLEMKPIQKKKQQEYNYMVSDSFSNFSFYEDALDVLIESGRIAKYSFIFQFFSRDNQTDFELFHFNQKTLVTEVTCRYFLHSPKKRD